MPNFYTNDFPRIEAGNPSSALVEIKSWRLTRESSRFSSPNLKNKMRAMEKYAAMVRGTRNKHAAESEAQAIYNEERLLAEIEQKHANFLGIVYEKAMNVSGKPPHEVLEAVFNFVSGSYPGFDGHFKVVGNEDKLLAAVAEVLSLSVQHCESLGVSLTQETKDYELQQRPVGFVLSTVPPAAVTADVGDEKIAQTGAPTITPMADAAAAKAVAEQVARTGQDAALEEEVDALFSKPAHKSVGV